MFAARGRGGAQRIGGPDQPWPTGPQVIVAVILQFLQAAHPLYALIDNK